MDGLHWLQQFHLIRPYWLLALIPLALIVWLNRRLQVQSRSWASVIDKRLLPHLLQHSDRVRQKTPAISLFLAGILVIFALAGPAFEKRPQPVFKARSALVILLDLSRSMDAGDIRPSRLSRARFKVNDILKQRREGQTALIAYAASAYVVSPLTDDAETIIAQIPALDTDIMPSQGSRADIALLKARELFKNAGHSRGDIFIISDGINKKALKVIKQLKADGFNSSVLAIGSAQGAPIPATHGGFVKDRKGNIIIPRLDTALMQQAARNGGGEFSLLTADDSDINRLLSVIDINNDAAVNKQADKDSPKFKTDVWREEGPWLLLLVIPFAAYVFRKGVIFALLIFILPLPRPAQALDLSALWKNSEQRGVDALEQGQADRALELLRDPQWKAAASYKAGQYQQAAELLEGIDTAEASYNRGNALAKAGQLDQAIAAYNRALQLQPDHRDAQYNKKLLEELKKKQQEQQQQNNQKSDDKKSDSQKNSQPSDQQNKQGSQQDQNQNPQQSDSGSSQDKQNRSENNSSNRERPQQQNSSADKQQQDKIEQPSSAQEKSTQQKADQQAPDEAAKKTQSEQDKSEQQADQPSAMPTDETPDLTEQQTRQWLKKIPDDPGGLLRRKFKYQYSREQHSKDEQPW